MPEAGEIILKITMASATVWTVKRFWESFYEKKKTSIFSVCVWCIFCIFQVISQWNSANINILMTCINVVLLFTIAIFGYESKGKEKYFLLIIFCSVWSLVELVVFFILSSMRIKEKISMLGMVISTLFMVILVYIVSVVWNKNNGEIIPNKFYVGLLFIPLGSIYIAVNQFYFNNSIIFSAVATSILLLFNVIFFEIYFKMNEIFIYEKEKTVYVQQIDIISGNTLEQKKIMKNFHEEKHNLVNELVALKGGIEKDDKEMVVRNINRLINNCGYVGTICNSGNSIVDAIINFKYAIAKEYGIDLRLKIFIPDELPIEQCDIGIVLGNAIDNAIEATKDCNYKKKIIEISMGLKKQAWVLVIKNPFEHEIKKDKSGKILSTKQEKYGHGYGLKSIMRIAETYQGEAIIDAKNNLFSLTVVLNLNNFCQ